jgi:uncharacterized protein YebE (UPF0316 family)
MDNQLLLEFIIFTMLNVIIQTAKGIITIKGGKFAAASANAVAYGLYTYIIALTMCDLPMLLKCVTTAIINFVGVYLVKWGEEKTEKTKLWKIEISVLAENADKIRNALDAFGVSRDDGKPVGKWVKFDTYCYTKEESAFVKKVVTRYKAKCFASASEEL